MIYAFTVDVTKRNCLHIRSEQELVNPLGGTKFDYSLCGLPVEIMSPNQSQDHPCVCKDCAQLTKSKRTS